MSEDKLAKPTSIEPQSLPSDCIERVEASDTRSFWTMIALVIQNAFNDKAAQTMLIALGVFLANAKFAVGEGAGLTGEALQTASAKASALVSPSFAILILIPFIFLAPVAGWISDRYSKTYVLRAGAIMQMAVLACIFWAISLENFNMAIVGFGLLALQSTILSPAKKGIVKEMLGSERLGSASGVLELSSVLAICVGQIVSGFWFNNRMDLNGQDPWISAHWPLLLLFFCSIPTVIVSFTLKVYPSPSKRPFEIGIIWEHVGQMKDLIGDSKIRLSALAIGFFWFVAGFINIVAIQAANELTSGTGGGMGVELAYFLTAASGGMILGGGLASYACRRTVELGLVPIGGIVMIIGSICLACVPLDSIWFKLWISFTGMGAAMFLVPLNAYLQDNCAEEKRGKVLAGSNLLDAITGAVGVGLFIGLNALDVGIPTQFIILAVLCAIVTVYATRILPQHFVRFTVLTFLRVIYKQKVLNAERLPSEGGVLIVPNHVTYLDAFMLTACSTRPIRFLMFDSYFKKAGLVRFFIKFFDTVPISETRAKDAIQKAADAVAEGGVVCIFPEGQLTRSGCMNELKRGFEMIARKAKCPVVPVYMDGLWGSIFSFERGKFIYKWPYHLQYGVTIAWGEPMSAREATAVAVREKLTELSSETFSYRDQLKCPIKAATAGRVEIKQGSSSAREKFEELTSEVSKMTEEKAGELVYNALQLSDVHALRRQETIALYLDELADAEYVLSVVLPRISRFSVLLLDSSTKSDDLKQWHTKYDIKNYFGADGLRSLLDSAGLSEVPIFNVKSNEASELCYPVKVIGQRVIAMSMPHPTAVTKTNQFQAGWKEGSYGRVLPGYHVNVSGEKNIICDPRTKEPLLELPVDVNGFMDVE